MALLPGITLIIGGSLLTVLRGRRIIAISLISSGLALSITGLLLQQLPTTSEISVWRPTDLFGSGLQFGIDATVWPFLLIGSAAVFAESILKNKSAASLLYVGVALAAVAAANPLAVAALWTIMILLESLAEARDAGGIGDALGKSGGQFVSVLALMAAAYGGGSAHAPLALGVIIRSFGGSRFPFASAIMAPLAAYAAMSRYVADPTWLQWIALAIVGTALLQSIFYEARWPWFALALAAASLASPAPVQTVTWIAAAAVLAAYLGLRHLVGQRFAWLAIALFPMAYLSGTGIELGILATAILTTAILVSLARLMPDIATARDRGRIPIVSVAALLASSGIAIIHSGLVPSVQGFLGTVLGLVSGYAISLVHSSVSGVQAYVRQQVETIQAVARSIFRSLSGTVRTTVNVIEGESAVLWILLALLIAAIGLQVIAA